jgi:hypothetical protein
MSLSLLAGCWLTAGWLLADGWLVLVQEIKNKQRKWQIRNR